MSSPATPTVEINSHLRKLFAAHATSQHPSSSSSSSSSSSEPVLTREGFVNTFYAIPSTAEEGALFSESDRPILATLFDVADSKAASVLTFEEFQAFRELLSRPDGDLQLVLRLFAPQQQSQQEQQLPSLPLSHVKQVLREHTGASTSQNNVEVDLDAPILAAFVDDRKSQSLSAASFVELIRAIPAERLRQMFTRADSSQSGSISPSDFRALAKAVAADKIADEALDNALPRLVEPASSGISFATATAFFNVVRAIDQVELIARVAAEQSEDGASLDRADFANVALRMARTGVPAFSPLEIEVLFAVASPAGSERLQLADLRNSLHPSLRYRHPTPSTSADKPQIAGVAAAAVKKYKDDPRSALVEMLFQAYTFGLGAIGGAFGATVVYPIDLVKTRMQNQRSAVVGEVMYKNSIDCFRKVVRNEGLRGLYSGLLPQLVGVAPEKAIKLTMNDLVRSKFRDPQTGEIKVWAEILAGCTAGGSQVVFTNPLEIVKIRLQVQGEKMGLTKSLEGAPRRSAISIVRELGLLGLYKGAGACLLRDIPFSGIYFPVYAHLKKDVFHEGKDGKRLGMGELLLSGAIAGMPAAYLVTPADVIKTRLQVEARKGQATYSGIVDAARKIYAQEGASAFFKGGVARVLRSSPQFACTLMMYEVLQKTFPFPGTANYKELQEAKLNAATAATPMGGRSRGLLTDLLHQVAPTWVNQAGSSASSAEQAASAERWAALRVRGAVRMLKDIDPRIGAKYIGADGLSTAN